MLDHTFLQPAGALCFLYAGIVIALLYAVFDFLRKRSRCRFFFALFDVCFALFAGFIFFAALLLVTGGELRAYAFLLTGLGFGAERATIHRLLCP